MPQDIYRTTIPYSKRLHELGKRIMKPRYAKHNRMIAIEECLDEIEQHLDYIDDKITIRQVKARTKPKENQDELPVEADEERAGRAEKDSEEGAA